MGGWEQAAKAVAGGQAGARAGAGMAGMAAGACSKLAHSRTRAVQHSRRWLQTAAAAAQQARPARSQVIKGSAQNSRGWWQRSHIGGGGAMARETGPQRGTSLVPAASIANMAKYCLPGANGLPAPQEVCNEQSSFDRQTDNASALQLQHVQGITAFTRRCAGKLTETTW